VARAFAARASDVLSSIVTGSFRAVSQIGVMLVLLFYFLRDSHEIAEALLRASPFDAGRSRTLFDRIAITIRVSLLGKVAVSALQGLCGGLMFWWLGLPAPAFWGLVMGVLSVIPVMGAFVIWAPAAATLAAQGEWKNAIILTVWGILVIHPIDNLLGPVFVGNALRLHTLVMFFAVIGGLAAFGGAGIVLGPVIAALVVAVAQNKDEANGAAALTLKP
jgi:predicted PurR-regulated permease PerM